MVKLVWFLRVMMLLLFPEKSLQAAGTDMDSPTVISIATAESLVMGCSRPKVLAADGIMRPGVNEIHDGESRFSFRVWHAPFRFLKDSSNPFFIGKLQSVTGVKRLNSESIRCRVGKDPERERENWPRICEIRIPSDGSETSIEFKKASETKFNACFRRRLPWWIHFQSGTWIKLPHGPGNLSKSPPGLCRWNGKETDFSISRGGKSRQNDNPRTGTRRRDLLRGGYLTKARWGGNTSAIREKECSRISISTVRIPLDAFDCDSAPARELRYYSSLISNDWGERNCVQRGARVTLFPFICIIYIYIYMRGRTEFVSIPKIIACDMR